MRLAAIDIGSNSVHMVVVQPTGAHAFEVIDREKRMVKLGAGAFRTHRLSEPAMAAAIEALRNFAKLAESLEASEILAVATSATREAENGTAFLRDVEREAGIVPRIITGIDEARLIFRAVQHAIRVESRCLVIDIGGGSVEIVGGDRQGVLLNYSLKLGVQRLRDLMGDGALNEEELNTLRAHIRGIVQPAAKRARALGFDRLVGTSGTIRALAQATVRARSSSPKSLNTVIATLEQVQSLAAQLTGLERSERAKVKGIDPERTDTLHLGAVLVDELIQAFGHTQLMVCDASLREGVILDALDRRAHPGGPEGLGGGIRERNVARLAYKFGHDTARPSHVGRLAGQLFDQTATLHGLSDDSGELLKFAAQLFGIGQFIAFKGYQNHSAYIIEHSGLRGFSHEEIDVLTQIVRFHRKRVPKSRELAALSEGDRAKVRVLSAILGIAVVLDRSHSQAVRGIRCERRGGGLWIWAQGSGDMDFEIWSALTRVEMLSSALGVEVEVERDPHTPEPESDTTPPPEPA